ncbi:MAG: HD domain-containing protein [Bacteroidota bacterium]
MMTMDYKGAEEYILQRLESELPENLYYHNFRHTLDVLESAVNYSKMEKIDEYGLILLKTAALYHDCGFLNKYSHNEDESVIIVHDTLPKYNYNHNQVESVKRMILCTEIPQKPKTILEKILCDADLDYLGRNDFFMTGICLLREWNENGINTSLREWYIQELYFLQQHEYFTLSACKLRNELKLTHLQQIRDLLGENL